MRTLHPCTLASALTTARRVSDSLPPCRAQSARAGTCPRRNKPANLRQRRANARSVARRAKDLSLERQAERLSAFGGLAQPPLAAVLRAEARTHYLGAKSGRKTKK